jgi:hypothetical protein
VTRRQQLSADLPRRDQQLIELQMVVAQAARNRRATGEILGDKWPHHVLLETLLLADHVIRNAESLGHTARVVHIVDGAAASVDRFGHAVVTGKPPLVPQLQRESHNRVTLLTQHGRDGGRIHTARHGYGDGLRIRHLAITS